MRLAIMQPYFFPYLGYFQLIDKVDKFVIYDDVSFIKNGWINRNRILVQGEPDFITLPIDKASSNKKINETFVSELPPSWHRKILQKVRLSYQKSPFFEEVFGMFVQVLEGEKCASKLAFRSIVEVVNYLGIKKDFVESSSGYKNEELSGEDRVIDICKLESANSYVNLPGGKGLYSALKFHQRDIRLYYLDPEFRPYHQGGSDFVPGLSILDILFNVSRDEALELIRLGGVDESLM